MRSGCCTCVLHEVATHSIRSATVQSVDRGMSGRYCPGGSERADRATQLLRMVRRCGTFLRCSGVAEGSNGARWLTAMAGTTLATALQGRAWRYDVWTTMGWPNA